ncbi:MAG TPA: BBP7 family outer membrane beta-barrel protein [Pirellulaceae bacterium]
MRKLNIGWFLLLITLLGPRGPSWGQHWYEYSAPPRDFDWQLFAPVQDSLLDCDERDANEGFFYNTERGKFWIMRPERAAIGIEGGRAFNTFSPSSVNYIYAQFANTTLPNGLTGANKGNSANLGLRFPIVGTGTAGTATNGLAQTIYNGIDDAYAAHADGWGNHFEFGWVEGYHGWMVMLHQGIDLNRTDLYGFDDKRRRQLGGADGLDGIDGIPDLNGTLPGGATNPVAPVNGIQGILAIDGLLTVPVVFDDPDGLLRGFRDANQDQLADDLNNDGQITAADLINIAVVFDEMEVNNQTNVNSVEVMAIRRKKPMHGGGVAEIFFGARYLEFDDRFAVTARGGTLADSFWDNHALNRLVGPQFGLRVAKTSHRWTSTVEGRFMAGANFLSVRQNGTLADHITNGTPGVPNAFGGNTFFHRVSDESFSPVGELSYESGFLLTRGISLKVGWMGNIAGGVQRAANTVVYRVPQLGIREKREEVFTHGVTAGIEINR